MRITRIRIGSFGGISDRDYRMGEGMTVLHGPNESGKTSTMEFIRRTLSPSRSRNLYPKSERTDNGELDTDSGTLELRQKDVSGNVPEVMASMDPAVFRTVFAMGPSDLDDADVVTTGDVRSRFLTVPGGERVADTKSLIDASVRDIVGLKSNSKSELLALEPDIARAETSVNDLRGRSDEYGKISHELSGLEAELETIRGGIAEDSERKRVYQLYQSNRANYDRLAVLGERRAALGEFTRIDKDKMEERTRLRTVVQLSGAELAKAEEELRVAREGLRGMDRRRVSSMSDDIASLQDRLGMYRSDREYMDSPEEIAPGSTRRVHRPRKVPMLIGAMLAVAGLALSVVVSPYVLCLTVVGVVVAFFGYRRYETVVVPGRPVPKDTKVAERKASYEAEVSRVCGDIGFPVGDMEVTVNGLVSVSKASKAVSDKEAEILLKRNSKLDAENKYGSFLMPYSGEEGFDAAVDRTGTADRLDSEILSLRSTLVRAGLDPDVPECPVPWEDDGTQSHIDSLNVRIGEARTRMNAILESNEIEKAMDELSVLRHTRDSVLRRGAVALLSKEILSRSCTAAFETVQPDVVRTADRYIGMMTSGRYRLEMDPENGNLVLSSDRGRKGLDRCSSGLRAQLLLSIKLAIAKEMGGGQVPMILDDLLLPFDTERKRGALEALAMVSEEMQVILFTCDSEVRDMVATIDGITLVDMVR